MNDQQAITHLENMKWLKGYDNTSVDGVPLADIIDDIIALLREQEPVKPIRLENWWECPSCNGNIVANLKYCPGCGRKVKWDEAD